MTYFFGKARILLIILLSSKAQEICSEYDITKYLNESISNIFAINAQDAIELISTVRNYKIKEFEYNVSQKVNPFQTKFFFQNISIRKFKDPESEECISPQLHWEFVEKKMSLSYEDFRLIFEGMIGAVKGQSLSIIRSDPGFRNFTLTAVRSYIDDEDVQFSYNTEYSGFGNWIGCKPDVYWRKVIVSESDEERLEPEIMSALLAMIRENLYNNRDFAHALEEIFQVYEKPRKEMISKHPDFLTNPHRYYYFIPKHNFFRFILKNIIISGLSNFKSFKFIPSSTSGIFTHTLLVRDVRGNMTLDYRSENETGMELNFQINYLFVSKKEDIGCAFAQAKYYTVIPIKPNVYLNAGQSGVIMNGLESAIASWLFPSMKVGKTCYLETPLEEMEISKLFDRKYRMDPSN